MSYIVPMKKPICISCPFRSLDNCTLICLMSDKDCEVTVYTNTMATSPDCPLVEVPEKHGELIERKAVIDICGEKQGTANSIGEMRGISRVWKAVKKLPTIIEAEGSGS